MSPIRKVLPLGLILGLAFAAPAVASAAPGHAGKGPVARAAQESDDAPVLPSRVANAISRAQRSLDKAAEHIDENEFPAAIVSLRSLRRNMYRADKAATRLLAAPAPPEGEEGGEEGAEEGAATPVDSVVAVLGLEHQIVTGLAGLFDTTSQGVVDGLTHALFRTLNARDRMLGTVIGLDPEGAGADFADSMADNVGDYADEVANLTEALADDTLSAGGKTVLTAALAQVTATNTTVTAAFGGGE
jgi:hypothetical protein